MCPKPKNQAPGLNVTDTRNRAGRLAEAERRLSRKEEMLQEAFDRFPAGIYEVDFRKGRIVDANETMCRYSGYTKEELLEFNPYDLLTRESQKLYDERIKAFLSGKDISDSVHYSIRAKDGSVLICLLHNKFLYEDGRPVGAQVIIQDVTGQWKTQETLRRQSMALEQSFDGIAIFNMQRKAIFINQAWADMHGYESPDELIHKDMSHFHSKEQFQEQVLPALESAALNGSMELTIRHVRKDGQEFPTRMSTSVVVDDDRNPVALLGIA